MRYLYKFWSVENDRGVGAPLLKEWESELKDYNRRELIRGLQAVKPDNRKKYTVHVYLEHCGAYILTGRVKLYNHKISELDLED